MKLEQEKYQRDHRDGITLCYCQRDSRLIPGKKYGPVVRDVYVIECCTSGLGTVSINGREFVLSPGKCVCLFPGDVIVHTVDAKNTRSGVWCAIDGLNVGTLLKSAGISSEQPYAPAELFDEICGNVNKLVDTRDENDMGADFRRAARVYAIFGALLRSRMPADGNVWVQRAIGIIEANYYRDLTVSKIAQDMGLERSYFSTVFKERVGVSPSVYLNSYRIKKACELIRGGAHSIAKVAELSGFDPQNFARIFKRECGLSPGKYKKFIHKNGIVSSPKILPEVTILKKTKPKRKKQKRGEKK